MTADGFENLRALIDPKRRRGEGAADAPAPPRRRTLGADAASRNRVRSAGRVSRLSPTSCMLRWGVLIRDLLARETLRRPWRDLLPVLRRMEARGEVRGGRFVAGFSGEQFAAPEALELLRAVRRSSDHPEDAIRSRMRIR